MRRNILPSLFAVLAMGGAPALPAADQIVDVTLPESAILLPAKVLRGNDFKSFFQTLPADDRAKAELEWTEAQAKAKSGEPRDLSEINGLLAKLLAPGAVETLMAEYEPKLQDLNPAELAQNMTMGATVIPMMFSQPTPGQTPEQTKNKQMLGAMLSGIMTDGAAWLPTSGINDPKKLRSAIERLVAGAKSLGVKNIEELQALPFADFLGRVGPLVKEAKAAAGVYDIQIDAFLDSIKAVPAAAPAAGITPDEKSLSMTCTIFGKAYIIPVLVTKKDGHWVVSPKNGQSFGPMARIMGGGGGDEGPDEMPPMK